MRTLGILVFVSMIAVGCGGGGGKIKVDGGTDMGGAGGDMAMSSPDMAKAAMPDLAMANLTGCNGFVACFNMCMDQQCVMACYKNTTMSGQGLVMKVFACLEMACPSGAGMICDPMKMDPACDACYMAAQKQGGACYADLMNCIADKP